MKCSICEKEFSGFGNNPWPIRLSGSARCCDECNDRYVILGRLAIMNKPKAEALKLANMFNNWDFATLQDIG